MTDSFIKTVAPDASLASLKHEHQRVGIFIDTQNLYHSARSNYNSNVNYKMLVEAAVGDRRLIRAFAYVIKSETNDESKFFEALNGLGIETRVKDLQVFYSGEKKADWDVGIAIDIVRLSEKIDTVVLVSGDGDFLEVLRYVKSRGIRAEVMAFKKTTSAKLLEEVDGFIDLGGEGGKFLIPLGKTARMNSRTNTQQTSAPRVIQPRTNTANPRPAVPRPAATRPAPARVITPARPAQPARQVTPSPRPAPARPITPRSKWLPRKGLL